MLDGVLATLAHGLGKDEAKYMGLTFMDGSNRALGGVRPVVLLQKGWNAYRLLAVCLIIVICSPVNDWTLRSVAYSLQDGCLASICTSYNEDSERNLWGLTVGCCGNGVLVSHVFLKQESLIRIKTHASLLWQPETGRDCARCGTHATTIPSLMLSTKLTFPHPMSVVPPYVRSLATLPPSCIRATTT